MAEGILGLGSGQSTALNQELIDKLKAAERKAQVEPLETSLENLGIEREKFTEIQNKLNELLEAIKPFDLFVSGGTDAFEQKAASTTGDSVIFEAPDVSKLNNGITTVNISKLAQKDVFQSNVIDTTTKNGTVDAGTLDITIGGTTTSFDTAGKTYQELADEINTKTGMSASLEQVGSDSYRLIIKSSDTGLDNAITITGQASQALGYTTDGITENATNHILKAQNLEATIDGVDYNVSSNVITVDGGLKITALKLGEASINISDDKAQISSQVNSFVDKYNEFVTMLDEAISNQDLQISDKSALRNLQGAIKEKIFGQYGTDDKSLFNYGFEVDKEGKLSVNTTDFQAAIDNDFEGLKDLFIGKAEAKGLGTQLKEFLTDTTLSEGIVGRYDTFLTERKKTLTTEKDNAVESLDNKYRQLALQFAQYSAIISQMENSFSGLKQMILQSTAQN
ncbi:flagellar hook protein FliD [Malaciobacter mytili]|uniref:flagellar filament capping protein FliD n=1 Tax=Malaciobacter mytili TaxID=603050 RepID=UPI00100A6803|nr:flagellar filament capping protein FliD [Malaciobacter mytili]RXI48879.1 flagellar hook protein FliD [Malaciobacter mytili]